MRLAGEITTILNAAGIRHALIGALALSVYGVNRATLDVDLLAVDQRCLSAELWSDLQESGSAVEIRYGDLTDPLAGVARFKTQAGDQIDLIVGKFTWQQDIVERSECIEELDIYVVRPADLILLKLYAGGPQDAWDIHQLLASPSREELIRDVDSHLGKLPERCSELWGKIVQELV